jgi:hypothetical protein
MSLVTPTVVDGFLYWSSGSQDPRGPTPPKPIAYASFFLGGPVHSHELRPGAIRVDQLQCHGVASPIMYTQRWRFNLGVAPLL